MGPQHLRPVQLLCLLGAISTLPWAGALLCYEATSSLFRAVSFQNWRWLLMRSMVCKLNEGCEETLVLIETGFLNTTFLLMGCTRGHHKLFTDFHYIGTMRVTEVLNVLEKAQIAGAEPSSWDPAWGILSGLLLAFRD
uniref:LY6/PLAUR domain containing 4 n=1 Tax=Molossus molossus TaxID=27622 RepID=A0A7J8C9C3_MOLMO|nr:LY6/PLAUR domain containing 4 [Molossus molossus]